MSDGIHVVGLSVENVHRLRVAEVELRPGGRVVRVTGKNGAGKSSLLRSLRMAFGGAGEVLTKVINQEAEEGAAGVVRVSLSNGFTVTRRSTEANPKGSLRVVGPDGGTHRQGKLNELLGENHDFDVLSFFQLKPARQRDILLSLGDDAELATKLEIAKNAAAAIYDERTPVIAEQRRCRALAKPDGERPEPIDTTAETNRLAELQAKQRERADLVRKAREAATAFDTSDERVDDVQDDIRELERELHKKRGQLEYAQATRNAAEQDLAHAQELLSAAPIVDDEIEEVLERLAEASEISERLQPWLEWDRTQQSLETANERYDELTKRLDVAREEEARLVEEADIPVDGLTFDLDTDEPLLNGRPLAIASGAERIRMAVAIAVAADPELRIVLVDEANDLDQDSLAALDELAREHGFQIFCCRIGIEGPGEIVVDDGEAWSTQPALEVV